MTARITRRRPAAGTDKPAPRPSAADTARAKALGRAQARRTSGGNVVTRNADDIVKPILMHAPRVFDHHRRGEYLHVSDLIGKCLRHLALCERDKDKPAPRQLTDTDLLTFGQGNTIHDIIKARLRDAGEASPDGLQLWGNWGCTCMKTVTTTPSTLAEAGVIICPHCGTQANVYQEVPMRHDGLMVVGTPDVLLHDATYDCLIISELKSIAHDAWNELLRPKPDHVIQVLLYWQLMNDLGYRLADKVSVIYATKGYVFGKSPYKECILDVQSNIHRIQPYLESAREYVAFRNGANLPVRTECANDRAPKAKVCMKAVSCFACE